MKKVFIIAVFILLFMLPSCKEPKQNTTETEEDTYFNTCDYTSQINGIKYVLYPDGSALLSEVLIRDNQFNFYDTLVIPTEIEGHTVTEIYPSAFEGLPFRDIILPEKLQKIGDRAFRKSGIQKIVIPETVTDMGIEVFDNCPELVECVVNANVSELKVGFLYNCKKLENVVLSDSITVISDDAFGDCSSLSSVKLPKNLAKIGSFAFSGCSNAELEFVIPDTVSEIGGFAFNSTAFFDSLNADFEIVGDFVLIKCNLSSEAVTVPANVKKISSAFSNSVKEISIPKSASFCDFSEPETAKVIYY